MSKIRSSLLVVLTTALLCSSGASAQDEPSPLVGPSSFAGSWEGYDSDGVRLYMLFRADREVGPDVVAVSSTSRTSEGEIISVDVQFRVVPLSSEIATLELLNGSGTVMATFYSSEGLRLNWPGGREAVLARTLRTLPDVPPPTAYTMTFSAPIQARVLSMSGDWFANTPESAFGRAFRIAVLDSAAGTLAIGETEPGAPSLAAAEVRSAHVTRGRQDSLTLAFDDNGEELTFTWSSDSEISLSEGDGADVVVLRRAPPQHP